MSDRDAFDGEIERLFARSPTLDDGSEFARRVEHRLNRRWRIRATVLTTAGVLGGVIAVREAVQAGLSGGLVRLSEESDRTVQAARGIDWSTALDWLSGGGPDLVVAPTMPAFWLVSAGLIAAALFTALRANEAN